MRLLHTADWHAGRHLSRRSLDEGLKSALNQLLDFAISQKIDAVLLAGDVFDHTRPSPDSQQLVYQTLMRLSRENIPVVIIPGNHDSPGHWHALQPILQLAQVTVAAQLSTTATQVITTKSGPLHLATLPWPNERLLSPIHFQQLQHEDSEQPRLSWTEQVSKLVGVLCEQLPQGAPRLLMGHLMVYGSQVSCSERSLSVSDSYAISSKIFSGDLNYVALGHVHQPQNILAPCKCAYSGALRPMDFGESGQERGFYLVNVAAGKPTETEFIQLPPAQPLYQIEVQRETLEEQLKSYATATGYYKVIVHLTSPETGLADQVRRMLPGALIVKLKLTGTSTRADVLTSEKLLDPLETFRQFHLSQYQCPPEEDLMRLFASLLQEDNCETT